MVCSVDRQTDRFIFIGDAAISFDFLYLKTILHFRTSLPAGVVVSVPDSHTIGPRFESRLEQGYMAAPSQLVIRINPANANTESAAPLKGEGS